MDSYWSLKIFALFILIIFSGFFSGSEVALFSLDRKKIKNYFGESNLISRYISELLERPRRLLVVILLGNTTVNVSASIVGVSLALDFSAQHGISADVILTIQILVLTISIILFGELLPKVWASKNVIAAAKIANAHEFIMQMPDGYQTNIGDRGSKMSGGQRQRISIARAVLKNPPILILDEATSALDTESERLVQDALTKLMQSRTTLVIAHRLSTIQHAHEIIVLQKGEIIQRGTHTQLVNADGMYKKLYDLQAFV